MREVVMALLRRAVWPTVQSWLTLFCSGGLKVRYTASSQHEALKGVDEVELDLHLRNTEDKVFITPPKPG